MSSPSARFLLKSSDLFSKMAIRLVRRSTFSLPLPSLLSSLKSGMSERRLAFSRGGMIFLLIWSPMSGLPFRATISFEASSWRNGDGGVGHLQAAVRGVHALQE